MKKFTLLAIAAIAAGTQVGYAEDINGITVSTAENPVYYKISNMRAARMSYVNAEDGEYAAGDIIDSEGDVIGHDNAGGSTFWLPEYLPNESETPQIWSFPYMGLAKVDNKFWTAFSAMTEVMNPSTIYWWFEKAGKDSMYIHNAVVGGALKNKAENVAGRPSMSFSETAKQAYYVVRLTEEQLESVGFEDEEFSTNAFALSKVKKIAEDDGTVLNSSSCLDMNNYVTYNYEVESGETEEVEVIDEDGEVSYEERPIMLKYGFVGVNLCWNPLNPGSNDNVRINNGSLFKVEEVEDVEAVKVAIEAYKQEVIEAYRAQVSDILENEKEYLLSRIETLKNLPAIYSDEAKLDAIIASVNNITVDPSSVSTQEDVDVLEAQIQQDMEAQYLRAMALAGNGTVITLQQMFALRDWSALADEDEIEEYQLGNAYLSSTGFGSVKDKTAGSMVEVGYDAVTCILDKDATCEWTMEWVPGQGYRLKNGSKYIRQYGNWSGYEEQIADAVGADLEELEEGETIFDFVDTNQMSWALTEDPNLAAVFTFYANADAIQNGSLSETESENYELYAEQLGYDPDDTETLFNTTNIAHITAPNPEGETTTLVRDTGAQDYIVACWNGAGNRYFANPNCWKIEKVQAGEEIPDGIEEIAVSPKSVGIYDLQGRKVAKAGKGLYIINGVKTLVK